MTPSGLRRPGAAILLAALTFLPGAAAQARQVTPQPPPRVTAGVTVAEDARQVRRELEAMLRRLPPSVGAVLRLDSSLLRNERYLETYPELAAFLQARPEVVNNPEYFLENINPLLAMRVPPAPPDARREAILMWRSLLDGLTVFAVFLVVTAGILWLVRSLIDLRRWSRTSRIQAEVHGKLLDRLASNEDLLAYIQTPPGRRFLEAAPVETSARLPIAAPISRILLAVQAGVVLATAGLGLLYVSTRVVEEIGDVLFAVSVLVLAVGSGFVLAAGASYLLSRRLGLLDAPPRIDATEA